MKCWVAWSGNEQRVAWHWVICWRPYGIYDPGGLGFIPVLLNPTQSHNVGSLNLCATEQHNRITHNRPTAPLLFDHQRARIFLLDIVQLAPSNRTRGTYASWFVESQHNKGCFHLPQLEDSGSIKDIMKTDDFAVNPPPHPFSFTPRNLAMLFSSSSGWEKIEQSHWEHLPNGTAPRGHHCASAAPPLPHRPDWCVPALFSRWIIGIIEWRVVLRAELQPKRLHCDRLPPLGCQQPRGRAKQDGLLYGPDEDLCGVKLRWGFE